MNVLLFSSLCIGKDSSRKSYNILTLNEDVIVDGFLNESIWSKGTPMTNFIQKDPQPGSAARNKTEVRIAIDDEYLYVGAYLFDNSPDSIARQVIKRDGWGYADWFAMGVDSYYDRRTCFGF